MGCTEEGLFWENVVYFGSEGRRMQLPSYNTLWGGKAKNVGVSRDSEGFLEVDGMFLLPAASAVWAA